MLWGVVGDWGVVWGVVGDGGSPSFLLGTVVGDWGLLCVVGDGGGCCGGRRHPQFSEIAP